MEKNNPLNQIINKALLSSEDIRRLCLEENMIEPFNESIKKDGMCSYGLGESSYDITLSSKYKKYVNQTGEVLSLKKPQLIESSLVECKAEEEIILMPGEFVLGVTNEKFNMPKGVTGFLSCKSSLARLGVNMPYTILRAGWNGYLVLEIQNINNCPISLAVNEGIGSVSFFPSCEEDGYSGQFQNQKDIVVLGSN